jgi:hypothetical protein
MLQLQDGQMRFFGLASIAGRPADDLVADQLSRAGGQAR